MDSFYFFPPPIFCGVISTKFNEGILNLISMVCIDFESFYLKKSLSILGKSIRRLGSRHKHTHKYRIAEMYVSVRQQWYVKFVFFFEIELRGKVGNKNAP